MLETRLLGEIASQIRSKNAGPFWQTIDVFFHDRTDYDLVLNSGVLRPDVIASIYKLEASSVDVYELPDLLVLKVSFPRKVASGDFHDRDIHAGQQHVPLSRLAVPRSM